MFVDAEVVTHLLEGYEKEVIKFVEKHTDNLFARNALPIRKVDESVGIDIVTEYSRTGPGAIIAAKGAIPTGSKPDGTEVPHAILQILDGFDLIEKDLKTDPKLKSRSLNMVMKNIHRAEDLLTIAGNAIHNASGIQTIGPANPNGKGVASGASGSDFNNAGSWDGLDTTRDIHQDVLAMIARLGSFEAASLVGHKNDLLNLFALDAQRQPFADTVGVLFGKKPKDYTWVKWNNQFTQGTVYLMPYDDEASEFVISENPKPDLLSKQRGGVYPLEIREWVIPEFHSTESVVSCVVT